MAGFGVGWIVCAGRGCRRGLLMGCVVRFGGWYWWVRSTGCGGPVGRCARCGSFWAWWGGRDVVLPLGGEQADLHGADSGLESAACAESFHEFGGDSAGRTG